MPNEPSDFYEVGREYYWLARDLRTPTGVMVIVTGHVDMVVDPRNGMSIWAQPTNLKGNYEDGTFTVWAPKGTLVPVERPSGEAKIFSEFMK
jgi:hypothetical protein